MGWNCLSIPKLQWCNRWCLGMDKQFHPTLYWACDYLSMLVLKLIRVSKRGPWWYNHNKTQQNLVHILWDILFYFDCLFWLMCFNIFYTDGTYTIHYHHSLRAFWYAGQAFHIHFHELEYLSMTCPWWGIYCIIDFGITDVEPSSYL